MAQGKLWFGYCCRTVIMGLMVMGLIACVHTGDERPVGMTLLFQSAGHPVGVARFDPDGLRGPVPGAVGEMYPRGGAIMSFMPGDSKRAVPQFVDVEWMVSTAEYRKEREALDSRSDRYSKQWMQDSTRTNQRAPHHTKRIDLTPIITPDLVERVRADRQNTKLKLIITFNNDQVDIKAEAEKWR